MDVLTCNAAVVGMLPTFSPPIVMVKLTPELMLAPVVVMTIRLLRSLLSVAANADDSKGKLQESMTGVIPVA